MRNRQCLLETVMLAWCVAGCARGDAALESLSTADLMERLGSADRAEATGVLEELVRRGSPVLMEAVAGLEHEDERVRCAAAELAIRISCPAWASVSDYSLENFDVGMRLPRQVVHRETGIAMTLVPGGTLEVGEAGDIDFASLARSVDITRFYIGTYEVTRGEWARMRGGLAPTDPRKPIGGVSWDEVADVLGRTDLRLPTSDEWEWACGGLPAGPLWEYAAIGDIGEVGTLRPNAVGAYDMLGNVSEWCGAPEGELDGHRLYPVRGGSALERTWCVPRRLHWPRSTWSAPATGFRVAKSVGYPHRGSAIR